MNFFKDNTREPMPNFDYSATQQMHNSQSYIVPDGLRKAVQVAMFLGQPLLLTGEPGTGKTQLAYYLAHHFNPDFDEKSGLLPDNFFIFHTKTTSSASDLFYRYDALKHFQFAQLGRNTSEQALTNKEVEERFVKYQALGEAIRAGKRCIVLIDEIDKAPRDLPNDILHAIDRLEFDVPEIDKIGKNGIKTVQKNRPIVILTSNSEKNLPDAFLRRCVYYHIAWEDIPLEKILQEKTTSFNTDQITAAVTFFKDIRATCKRKKPATAEFLQWITIIEKLAVEPLHLNDRNKLSEEEKNNLKTSFSLLVKDKEDLAAIKNKFLR